MKKIAFITSGYFPVPAVNGGAVENLIDILIESEKLNTTYQICVYSTFDKNAKIKSQKNKNVVYKYIKNNGVFWKIDKILRFLINKFTNFYIGNSFISKLIKIYKSELDSYDYVIVENKPEYVLRLKKYIKGKIIFHSHNDFLNINTKNAKKIYDSYDMIFGISKYICSRMKEISPEVNKVKLLYNGVDVDKFNININKKSERKKWKINENDIVFLYTGRIVEEKGILQLIKAFNKIKENNNKLIVVGSIVPGKNFKDTFLKKIEKLSKKNPNIIFTGFIKYDILPRIYKICDYGIVPSIWEEPFALTVIEHLASGHPVIATNSGGIPELINSNNSIIVEKNERLEDGLYFAMKEIQKKRFNKQELIRTSKSFDKNQYIDKFKSLLEMKENTEENNYEI